MTLDRTTLKAAAVALLDTLTSEHSLGRQDRKAPCCVFQAPGRTPLEIMFKQEEDSGANLWTHRAAVGALAGQVKSKPASDLWTKSGKNGPLYGRHSSLRPVPQLGDADLVCFTPLSLADLGEILNQLTAASAARIIP